jgi:hypothetical protein
MLRHVGLPPLTLGAKERRNPQIIVCREPSGMITRAGMVGRIRIGFYIRITPPPLPSDFVGRAHSKNLKGTAGNVRDILFLSKPNPHLSPSAPAR